jgi:sodium transport system permease protein
MLSTLLFGPLFAPLMFTVMIQIIVDRTISSAEDALKVPIVGIESAQNLRDFMLARGIEADDEHELISVEDAAREVREGKHGVVVVLDEAYAEQFASANAARITVVFDRSNSFDSQSVQRVQAALGAYSQQIGALRLLARGLNPSVTRALLIDERDVSTPAGRSALLLGVLTYFLLFATLMGGMYLAIDTTAGERERKSLEPLLSLPVTRETLLTGKVLATVCFMLLSLALAMSSGFNAATSIKAFGLLAPFAILGALLMTLVASFTRSYKEAQTYLGLLLIVPTLPVAIATVLDVDTSQALMWVPSMSQHLLITALIKQESIEFLFVLQSVVSTLLYAGILWLVTAKIYKREALLG